MMAPMSQEIANKVLAINIRNDLLETLMEGFESEVSISFASEGSKAMEMAHMYKPDLILLDVMMVDASGFEVCQELKADPKSKNIPVIFLTRSSDEETVLKGLEAGATDFITEPFTTETLVARVRSHLKQVAASREWKNPKEKMLYFEGETRDRRAEGAARGDRYPKTPERPTGLSLRSFLILALFVAGIIGGWYAWFVNSPETRLEAYLSSLVLFSDAEPEPQDRDPELKTQPEELIEEMVKDEVEDKLPPPVSDTQPVEALLEPEIKSFDGPCGEIPQVAWWGGVSHESIIEYVALRNDGDWDAYVAKWARQLSKLHDMQVRGVTGVAPDGSTRLEGAVLGEYIEKFEARLEVARCLAFKSANPSKP